MLALPQASLASILFDEIPAEQRKPVFSKTAARIFSHNTAACVSFQFFSLCSPSERVVNHSPTPENEDGSLLKK